MQINSFECHKAKGETDTAARGAEFVVQDRVRAERDAKLASDRARHEAESAQAAKDQIQFHIDQAAAEGAKRAEKDAAFKRSLAEFDARQAERRAELSAKRSEKDAAFKRSLAEFDARQAERRAELSAKRAEKDAAFKRSLAER